MRIFYFRKRTAAWLVVILLLIGVGVYVAPQFSERLQPEVYVAGLRYTPKRASEVRQALETRIKQPFTLTTPSGSWSFSSSDLGLSIDLEGALAEAAEAHNLSLFERLSQWLGGAEEDSRIDIEVGVQLDPAALRARLTSAGIEFETEAVEPRLFVTDGEMQIQWGRDGYRLDLVALEGALERVALSPASSRTLSIPRIDLPPSVTNAELEALDELHLLSSFTTEYAIDAANAGRVANIELAASMLDGVIVAPEGEFSLNRLTGPRGEADGYQTAPVIINGELVPGIGGGVSQLASTVFNAALLGGMEVSEYHSHSLPISYLPLGRDATVWYDTLDLRFVNPWESFVAVQVRPVAGRLMVELWSPLAADALDVSIETEVVERFPAPIEERTDRSLPVGERRLDQQGRDGQRLAVRQRVYWDGELIAQRIMYASYRSSPQVWRVGDADADEM